MNMVLKSDIFYPRTAQLHDIFNRELATFFFNVRPYIQYKKVRIMHPIRNVLGREVRSLLLMPRKKILELNILSLFCPKHLL
jgi:hypothetical protein